MACAVRGRPGRRGYIQRLLTRLACQRSTVRGETIKRSWPRWPLGSNRASVARIAGPAPRRFGCLHLPLEHGDLVAQDEDLGVLGTVGACEQGKPAEYAQCRQVGEP